MVDLITGKAGKPHIDGNSLGVLNAGIIGPGDYALDYGDKFAITLDDSNHATIGTGCAMLNGRQALISTPEQVTITSGSQGMKRNDLICLRYQRVVNTGIESCSLVVVRGTATTGTPADPAVNTGSILNLVTVHDMPLYRVPLDGITVGTPVPLFSVLQPMNDVWDSLTPARYSPYIQCGSHTTTTENDGTFTIGVGDPTGKPADYAAYVPGMFGNGFNDDGDIIVHRWTTSLSGVIRFRLASTKTHGWLGKTAIFGCWIAVWNRQ